MFIPKPLFQHAYENVSLPIAHGQTISQPYIVAKMTSALALTGKERVLKLAQVLAIRPPSYRIFAGVFTV